MLTPFVTVYIVLSLLMVGVWMLYRRTNNPSIVDVAWSIGLLIAGVIYLSVQSFSFKTIVITGLLTIWSLRLAGYIWYSRIRLQHVDKRYITLSSSWKMSQSLGFFLQYQFQAILIFLIACSFYFISIRANSPWSVLDYFAIGLVGLSIAGESLADWQLQHFKKANTGKVCDVGLWKFSRHPNYFFDWLTWCGFVLVAIQAKHGYFALISPLVLYVLFNFVTGPMTERASLVSRGQAFRDYQSRTSMFFPWFNN